MPFPSREPKIGANEEQAFAYVIDGTTRKLYANRKNVPCGPHLPMVGRFRRWWAAFAKSGPESVPLINSAIAWRATPTVGRFRQKRSYSRIKDTCFVISSTVTSGPLPLPGQTSQVRAHACGVLTFESQKGQVRHWRGRAS